MEITTIHLHSTAHDGGEVRAILDLMMMGQRDLILSGFDANLHASKIDMDVPDEPDYERLYKELCAQIDQLVTEWVDSGVKYKSKMAYELQTRTDEFTR